MYLLASKLIRGRMASEIASEVEIEAEKYTFAEIFEYLLHGQYPVEADKSYKHGLRKRCKFFTQEAGRLYYIGGERKGKATAADSNARRLVVISKEERQRIIRSIHDEGHLGRDKTLAQINGRYYWPEMYKEICAYVSHVYVRVAYIFMM